jgi:hypothetical protein
MIGWGEAKGHLGEIPSEPLPFLNASLKIDTLLKALATLACTIFHSDAVFVAAIRQLIWVAATRLSRPVAKHGAVGASLAHSENLATLLVNGCGPAADERVGAECCNLWSAGLTPQFDFEPADGTRPVLGAAKSQVVAPYCLQGPTV